MPARTTPMMLVHVYSDTPINGARMRPATSSRMRVQQLATKTTRNATGLDIRNALEDRPPCRRQVFWLASHEHVFWQSSPAGASPGLLALDLGCALLRPPSPRRLHVRP